MALEASENLRGWDADAKVMLEVLIASMGLDRYRMLLALIYPELLLHLALFAMCIPVKTGLLPQSTIARDRFFLVRSMAVVET